MVTSTSAAEIAKRRRERRVALFITLGFVVSTILQAWLTARRQTYGFVQSLLYFGLVHLNLILIMLLGFLVFRNLIKAYLARRSGTLGSSLKWRMVTSLLAFSMLPSIVLFTGSSYVIRQGFERWFGTQVARALEDAQAITNVHYEGIENNLEFIAERLGLRLQALQRMPTEADLEVLRADYPLKALELYGAIGTSPIRLLQPGLPDWVVPRAAVESLQRSFLGESFHLIRQYGDGDLVQRFEFVKIPFPPSRQGPAGETHRFVTLVLSETVPLGLKTRMADFKTALEGYQKTRLLKNDLKTTYSLVLLTLFLLTMFVVSWFGLYLAKNFTDPISDLLKGTEAFRDGNWDYRIATTETRPVRAAAVKATDVGADLEVLKAAFNLMAEEVGRRGRQLEEANGQLISLVRELEDRERYLETLLSSIRRGVIVLDETGTVTRINQEALEFASSRYRGAGAASALGRLWSDVYASLGDLIEAQAWLDEASVARGPSVDRIFEFTEGEGRASTVRSVRATGIGLRDERERAIGWMIILEDVSGAARLERLAAWQEVARRVAHEIKNPLTPIQLSIDRLARRLAPKMETDPVDGPVFKESVHQIQKQVRVIRDLVREFAEFSKLPEPKFVDVDLGVFLEGVLKDYRFTRPEIKFLYESEIPAGAKVVVRGDPEYLRRLVTNVADNAVQSLETARIKEPVLKVSVRFAAIPTDFVSVVFEDNGPGIPPEMQEKIFDPYITSKASGMGLGLAIVRRIAIEHSGRIRCEEGPGGRFVLELPLLNAFG